MPSVPVGAPQTSPSRHPLGSIALVCFLAIGGASASFYITNARVNRSPTTQPNLLAAEQTAQPLLDALEQYRADHGLYPSQLRELAPVYLPSLQAARKYRYCAEPGDWVLKDSACAEREKALHGWVMKNAKEYEKEVMDFKQQCLTGYRYYQLESPRFPADVPTSSLTRWAHYDSSTRQWNVAWLSYSQSTHRATTGMNGVCESKRDQMTDPWRASSF